MMRVYRAAAPSISHTNILTSVVGTPRDYPVNPVSCTERGSSRILERVYRNNKRGLRLSKEPVNR